MKRKYYIRAVLSLLTMTAVVAACTQSYPTLVYDEPENNLDVLNKDGMSNRTPIMMFVNPQDFFSISATRGSGPFPPADLSKYQDGTIYVYAFRSDYNVQGSVLNYLPDFTKTAYAAGYPHDTDFADCLLDGEDYYYGVPTKLMPESSGQLITSYHFEDNVLKFGNDLGQSYYYSNVYQETPYNFFAYYLDDAEVLGKHREADKIWYDLEIDGTQDIMCGGTPDFNKNLETRYSTQYEKLSDAEKNTIRNIGGFSKFAADRDIPPYIDMRHKLTRLEFLAYPADTAAHNLIITDIKINTTPRCKLTVAARDTSEVGIEFDKNIKRSLPLRMDNPPDVMGNYQGYIVDIKPEERDKKSWQDRTPVQIGENIILPSDTVYDIDITIAQRVKTTSTTDSLAKYTSPKKLRLELKPGEQTRWFEPGKIYTIHMAVYGRKEIEVYTTIQNWIKGDNVWVDDDEDDFRR